MKIKAEHLEIMRRAFAHAGIDAKAISDHRKLLSSPAAVRPPKDIEMRLRWDCMNKAIGAHWICDTLYSYLNDSHIDTALRNLVSEIERNSTTTV